MPPDINETICRISNNEDIYHIKPFFEINEENYIDTMENTIDNRKYYRLVNSARC